MRSNGAANQPTNNAITAVGACMRTEPTASHRFHHPMTRHFLAVGLWMLTVVLFWEPIRSLVRLSLNDERSTHIVVIPFISGFLIWLRRKPVFCESGYCFRIGVPLFLLSLSLWYTLTTSLRSLHLTDRISAAAL